MFVRHSFAFLLALPSVLVSAADLAQQPIQGACAPDVCDQLGCGGYQLENYPVTTNYQQVMTGPEPWPTPYGASIVGVGEVDGVTTVVFEVTKPAYIAVPTNPPGKWTVAEEVVTIPNGPGNTLIITSHALTTFPACPSPSTRTVTSITTTTLPPVTTTVDRVDYQTSYVTTTSTATLRTTDTQYITLPPITTFSTITNFVTSISVVTLPPLTVTSTTTTTATVTSFVTVSPPLPACTPAAPKPWTHIDIYTNSPFRFETNDPSPQILSIQDAGYKKERYSVVVDGQQIGTTSPINPDSGVWCALTPAAKDTCEVKGLSKGQFIIPPGSHVVEIVNIPGVVNNTDAYSAIFYQLERQCTPIPSPPCSQRPVQDVVVVDVYKNNPYKFSLNFIFPTRLTVVDAGIRAKKYKILVDGFVVGDTDAYPLDRYAWCGKTPDTYQNCLDSQMSKGEFVVPAGAHNIIVMAEFGIVDSNVLYSPMFYKIDTYCPS